MIENIFFKFKFKRSIHGKTNLQRMFKNIMQVKLLNFKERNIIFKL